MMKPSVRKGKGILDMKPYLLPLIASWTTLVGGGALMLLVVSALRHENQPVGYCAIGNAVIWVMGLFGIWVGTSLLQKRLLQFQHAEEALQESRILTEVLLNAPVDGAYLLDRQGVVLATNQAGAQRMGLTPKELIGRSIFDLFSPGLAEERCRRVAEVFRSGESLRFEDERAGRHLSNTLYPVFDSGGRVKQVAVFVQDITEARVREANLADALEKACALEAVISRSKLMMIRWRAEPDFPVEFVSPNVSQLGYTPQDFFSGRISWNGITHTDDILRVLQDMDVHMAGDALEFSTEYRLVDRDGNPRWVMDQTRLFRNEQGTVLRGESLVLEITDRKETEEALRESQGMLRMVLDTIPVRVFWKDRDLNYLGCNHSFAADAGLPSAEAIVGKSDHELSWAQDAESYRADDRLVMQTRIPKLSFEEQQTTPEGQSHWLRTSKVPLLDSQGKTKGVLGTYEDITERKQSEQALRESEERYRSLFQNNHAVMLLLDPDTGGIVDANPAACAYYGYDLETIRTLNISQINPLTPEQLLEEMTRAKAMQRNHFLFQHRLADGSVHPVEVFSGPIELHGRQLLYSIVHDITERKRAEEALRESRTILRTIIDAIPLWISCSDRQGIYLTVNDLYSKTFGKLLAEIEGSHYSRVLPQGVCDKHKPLMDECLSGKVVTFDDSHPLSNGRTLYTHGVYTPLFDAARAITGSVLVVMDVTPMQEAQEELRRLYVQTQRDADTKTELLKEVNHRVRNNLVAIVGLLLAEQRHAPEQGRSFVKTALDSVANRIHGMLEVHQLLSDSEWAPMRLSELAARVITAVFTTLPTGRRAVVEVPHSPIEVSPRQAANLALVINELATNTRKYALQNRKRAHIAVRIQSEDGGMVLEYRDDGPGYPEDVLRLERQGVGLYLLMQLVTGTLRGTLQLANAEGAVARLFIKTEETNRT
jgi:PAS domain S-box-containing protein